MLRIANLQAAAAPLACKPAAAVVLLGQAGGGGCLTTGPLPPQSYNPAIMANFRAILDLDKEVETRNTVNAKANEVAEALHNLLQLSIGKKVVKANGAFTAAFKKELDNAVGSIDLSGFRWYFQLQRTTSYTLWFNIDKTYDIGNGACQYIKKEIYLGGIRDQALESVESKSTAYTSYTVSQVIEAGLLIQEYEKKICRLKASIYEFC